MLVTMGTKATTADRIQKIVEIKILEISRTDGNDMTADIIGLSETHLVGDQILKIPGYECYGNNRKLISTNKYNSQKVFGWSWLLD